MKYRDLLGFAVEAARAPYHKSVAQELWDARGEKSKITAVSRMLPEGWLRAVLGVKPLDTLPITGFSFDSVRPIARGWESVVYLLPGVNPMVLKLRHTNKPESAFVALERYLKNRKLYENYLPDYLLPEKQLIYESPFGTGDALLASIQPFVPGSRDIFANLYRVAHADLRALLEGSYMMIEETRFAPDFEGSGNVLVDTQGVPIIVDTGNVIPADRSRLLAATACKMALIENVLSRPAERLNQTV
jgi:hypothetical protein